MNTQTLIPITSATFDDQEVNAVDARELHAFLDVARDFSNWIKGRIQAYGFVEGVDFRLCSPKRASKGTDFKSCFPKRESKGKGGHNAKDYALTLDMAKELAMVERTERGKQARRYFIECEKQLRALPDDSLAGSVARDMARQVEAFSRKTPRPMPDGSPRFEWHRIMGDANAPAFRTGDMVLIDRMQRALSWYGFYALEFDGLLSIVRLEREITGPQQGKLAVTYGNPDYGLYYATPEQLPIAGAVVWASKRV